MPNLKEDLEDQFGSDCPQVRTWEMRRLEESLKGLKSFAENCAFLSTQFEKLLEFFFANHSSDDELLQHVRKFQRCLLVP